MKIKFLQFFLVGFVALAGAMIFNVDKVEAACVVNQAHFRTVDFNPTTWYSDANPPNVYIDFQTTGCSSAPNNQFILSIREWDSLSDNSVEGFNLVAIEVPSNNGNFSWVARAGDQYCESEPQFDCVYYIKINGNFVNGATSITEAERLQYECNEGCNNKNWSDEGPIPYGQTLESYNNGGSGGTTGTDTGTTSSGGGSTSISIQIDNPIGLNNMTIADVINKIIAFALKIGIPIIAIAIIYSGLLFVTARGNDSQLETAKNAFTYAIIGGAILLGSWIFSRLIKETIESIAMVINYFG